MRLGSGLWAVLMVIGLSGCSLLNVKIENDTTPLTQQELSMRLLTREFAHQFFAEVEQAADQISAQYDASDVLHQSNVLLWKIHAEQGLQRATYQASPRAALIDAWVYTEQMAQFFQREPGKALFADSPEALTLAQTTSTNLASNFDQVARSVLNPKRYQNVADFVRGFAANHPFDDVTFIRTPAYRIWLEQDEQKDLLAVSTMGTVPEAVSDVSDRLSLAQEQAPKLLTWKTQLIALNSQVSSQQLRDTLRSVQQTSDAMEEFMKNNPKYMTLLAQRMAEELQPVVDSLDEKTAQRLEQLSIERKALDQMVERERQALGVMVADEREHLTANLDQVAQDVLTVATEKLIELLKRLIVYFVVFIAVIFFAPLSLGYYLGKRAKPSKKASLN